ncbi:MAG TPA: glycosyltransferase family 39 protein [Candidatus Angelobacter sp.]|nr:glycosyltransferase family 39 protein [Candidatus Angelobacter sp.]
MRQAVKELRIGRPQIFAGLLLLAFLLQCFWVSTGRRLSDLEYEYIASGFKVPSEPGFRASSPFTSLMAALPARLMSELKHVVPISARAALAIPRPWAFRLPFIIFGLWLGGALWWVARRLFGDSGGYIALALYCFSPAMVKISSNIGPEVILAWSSFGLIYTAIGVAHTVYAPPRKWLPRIIILGIAIGICLSTALWAFTIVLLACVFMLYLSPERRKASLIVLFAASGIGLAILGSVGWMVGTAGLASRAMIALRPSWDIVRNLGFAFADSDHYLCADYVLPALLVATLTVYGSWRRARYFGNTAPLITSFATVLLFAAVPAIHIWDAVLGLSFVFLFIAGVAADLLETPYRRILSFVLFATLAIKGVLGLGLLRGWIHQNPM